MKVIFMGTPDFAVNTLEKIIEAGHEVMLVVTQPDKPKGRGNTMQFPPVKECAVSHGLEVFQPVKIREDASVEYLKKFAPDICLLDRRIACTLLTRRDAFVEFIKLHECRFDPCLTGLEEIQLETLPLFGPSYDSNPRDTDLHGNLGLGEIRSEEK